MDQKPGVLFLCTGNSCRSQMAEGLLRHFASGRFNVYSAGTSPRPEVHPLAVEVMQEIDIDLSAQHPKNLTEYMGRVPIRHVIITCDSANTECPRTFPGVLHRHFWPFDDPAAFEGSELERLAKFREVRDQIRDRIQTWLNEPESL